MKYGNGSENLKECKYVGHQTPNEKAIFFKWKGDLAFAQ